MQYLSSSFYHQWQSLDNPTLLAQINTTTSQQVERALRADKLNLADMQALLSPAALPYLEHMAQRSHRLTRQRFGHTLGFFVPLYLSNLCANDCTYCGFSMSNKVKRKTLTDKEIQDECEAIKRQGFDAILIVTGEHETKVGMDYFRRVLPVIKRYFSYVMFEVQPLSQTEYTELSALGVDAVLVYQETYQAETYARHHLRGNKTDFRWRLETPERLARAGVEKIGLGCLLGLDNWRLDCLHMAMHLDYLQKVGWQSRYSVAFPRLRPCTGGIQPADLPNDKELVQLICAFRMFSPQLDIVMSTRESASLRDHSLHLGITQMSAGSKTQPGGYADAETSLSQFDIDDQRSPAQMARVAQDAGLEVVWKDWQPMQAYSYRR